jgi:hypothetical protein
MLLGAVEVLWLAKTGTLLLVPKFAADETPMCAAWSSTPFAACTPEAVPTAMDSSRLCAPSPLPPLAPLLLLLLPLLLLL